jgi:hypothetical protein
MAYTPPVGTVNLDLTGSYTPPVGTVNLDLGATATLEWSASIAGETLAPSGSLSILSGRVAVVAGETLAPIGQILAGRVVRLTIQGETLAPTGAVTGLYDSNLLSDTHRDTVNGWQEGLAQHPAVIAVWTQSERLEPGVLSGWQAAKSWPAGILTAWQASERLSSASRESWTEALSLSGQTGDSWQPTEHVSTTTAVHWQAGDRVSVSHISRFRVRLPLLETVRRSRWQRGTILNRSWQDGFGDGERRLTAFLEVWQQAGYPGNAPNPGPPIPLPIPWPWGTDLNLRCPLPGTTLRIGRTPCILVAEREIPIRRSYMTTNSASLVRWPDLTPLPFTSMTIETDFDSWCWSLTATLSSPEAWPLVQPNPLACEVLATVNGQVWRFLLDVPNLSRSFNSNKVTLKGRSRSAWLHDPFMPQRNLSQSEARDMTQLAEAAIENTGWSLEWLLEDWSVPAGRYHSFNTPIGALINLVNVTNDGMYTHPTDQIITLHKRWPVASWLLDGETMDILIPEAAILSLAQSPVYSQPYNGVYVSGTTHGVLALVKIEGTDGALQPAEPVTNELLCDEAGVAARQRGLNLLSDAGAGWDMDAETLFAPSASPAFPLVPPGQIVSIAGMKGISRSCRISAQRSGNALSVRQSIGLERREVEAT